MTKGLFTNKTILVTGGTGTIGSELVRQILNQKPRQVRVFSRNDSRQYHAFEELGYPRNVRMIIGDIRDEKKLTLAMKGVDVVFHAAALKHVPLCESNPYEAVLTNVVGSQNVINASIANKVKRMVAISTDKAANPDGVMGVTKLMMEKLVVNAQVMPHETKLACVRFGNVLWANGSVLPLWKRQITQEGAVHVTNGDMTRFFMTIPQAVGLVLKAAEHMHGGEVFVLKMPAIAIKDLARTFLDKYFSGQKVRFQNIGNRGGEKMHEDLISAHDRTQQLFENKELFILRPVINMHGFVPREHVYTGFRKVQHATSYSSADHIDRKKIAGLI